MRLFVAIIIISQLVTAPLQPAMAVGTAPDWDAAARAASKALKQSHYGLAESLYRRAISQCDRSDFKAIADLTLCLASVLIFENRQSEATTLLTKLLLQCRTRNLVETTLGLRILRRLRTAYSKSNPTRALEAASEAASVAKTLFGTNHSSFKEANQALCLLREDSDLAAINRLCHQGAFSEALELADARRGEFVANPGGRLIELNVRTAALCMTLSAKKKFKDNLFIRYQSLIDEILKQRETPSTTSQAQQNQIDSEIVDLAAPLADELRKRQQFNEALHLCDSAIAIATSNKQVQSKNIDLLKSIADTCRLQSGNNHTGKNRN